MFFYFPALPIISILLLVLFCNKLLSEQNLQLLAAVPCVLPFASSSSLESRSEYKHLKLHLTFLQM